MKQEMKREIARCICTWIALMVLLALTAGSAYLHMGIWNTVTNLGIAIAKALLVGMVFMHLKTSRGAIRAAVAVALFTLALLFVISGSDYATREFYPAPWQAHPQGMTAQGR